MTDGIKSPFWIDQNFLSSDEVADLASKLWVEPTRDEHGQEFPIQRNVPEIEKIIYDKIIEHIPKIMEYYDMKFKGCEHIFFHQIPPTNGKNVEEPHAENAMFKRKKWVRTSQRDLTGYIWFKDYNDTPPFNLQTEVYGGKLEFPVYDFGFQPQAGTMVVFPSCERFINLTTSVKVGDLMFAKFHIHGDGIWIYDPAKFPGDVNSWFTNVI